MLPDHDHLKAALASGMPVAFAIKIYTSFEGAEVRPTAKPRVNGLRNILAVTGHKPHLFAWVLFGQRIAALGRAFCTCV